MSKYLLILVLSILTPVSQAGKRVVMVFGDSLSAGYGVPLERAWVRLLENKLQRQGRRYQVVNASISGDTTQSGLARLPAALAMHRPEIVVLALGGNDGLRGLSVAQIRQNLHAMLVLLEQKKIKVLLVGVRLPPNYGPVYTKQFHQVYSQLGRRHGVRLLEFMLEGVAGYKQYMQPDGVHPNVSAQPLVMENIYKHLEPLLDRTPPQRSSRDGTRAHR